MCLRGWCIGRCGSSRRRSRSSLWRSLRCCRRNRNIIATTNRGRWRNINRAEGFLTYIILRHFIGRKTMAVIRGCSACRSLRWHGLFGYRIGTGLIILLVRIVCIGIVNGATAVDTGGGDRRVHVTLRIGFHRFTATLLISRLKALQVHFVDGNEAAIVSTAIGDERAFFVGRAALHGGRHHKV